jgi:uncharacterized protein YjbJ (UPF0337 family)
MKDQIKGKAEEVHGRLTGDKGEEMKGKVRQSGDKLRRTGRDIREDLKQMGRHEPERKTATER